MKYTQEQMAMYTEELNENIYLGLPLSEAHKLANEITLENIERMSNHKKTTVKKTLIDARNSNPWLFSPFEYPINFPKRVG